jgi:hypothetical protein
VATLAGQPGPGPPGEQRHRTRRDQLPARQQPPPPRPPRTRPAPVDQRLGPAAGPGNAATAVAGTAAAPVTVGEIVRVVAIAIAIVGIEIRPDGVEVKVVLGSGVIGVGMAWGGDVRPPGQALGVHDRQQPPLELGGSVFQDGDPVVIGIDCMFEFGRHDHPWFTGSGLRACR